MAKTNFATVDDYLATLVPRARKAMDEVRQALKNAVPDGEEVISYSVPAIKHHGWVFYFSAHTNHFSLSTPPPFAAFEEFKDELATYKRSKSAVRFPLDEPVPVDLIGRMARFQAGWNEKSVPAKKKAPR